MTGGNVSKIQENTVGKDEAAQTGPRHALKHMGVWCAGSPKRTAIFLGLLVALVGVLKYGIAVWPGWPTLFDAAANWRNPIDGVLLQPPQDYVLSSSILSIALGALHITTQTPYLTVYVFVGLLAVLSPFLMPETLRNPQQARLLYILLAGGPIVALMLTGIGGYDALTVVAMSVAVLSSRWWVVALGWYLVGLNHSALGLIALGIWALTLLANDSAPEGTFNSNRIRRLLMSLIAASAGALTMYLITQQWGGTTSRWEVYRLYEISYYLNALIAGLPLVIFSALGVGWVVLLDSSVRRQRSTRVVLSSAVLASFALPLVALDHTRAIAIVLYPAVLLWAKVMTRQLPRRDVNRLWSRYGIAATIIPVVVLLMGEPDAGTWQNILSWRASLK